MNPPLRHRGRQALTSTGPTWCGCPCGTPQREDFRGVVCPSPAPTETDLYHSALVVVTAEASFVIEMTPIPRSGGAEGRGVVAEGPVGTKWAGRLRIFRYEIHRWRSGTIADLSYAASPFRITDDEAVAREVLELVPLVPTPVWGRDELGTGEMWNSNSVTAWLLVSAGLDASASHPPDAGRVPGWDAGVAVAARRLAVRTSRSVAA